MIFRETSLDGVWLIQPEPQRDDRGFLARTFCENEFSLRHLNTRWVQQNHTMTRGRGSVRGLHWQAEPRPEIKLVRCITGRVLDVVVDVRAGSATFGKWEAFELSPESMAAVYIPAGFAHGFQCLNEGCELLYLMSDFYRCDLARGLRFDDADVGIRWPLPVANLSERDLRLPLLNELS